MTAREARVETVVLSGVSDPPGGAAGSSRIFPGRSALFLVPKEEKL
jgi:hypothetical protein